MKENFSSQPGGSSDLQQYFTFIFLKYVLEKYKKKSAENSRKKYNLWENWVKTEASSYYGNNMDLIELHVTTLL